MLGLGFRGEDTWDYRARFEEGTGAQTSPESPEYRAGEDPCTGSATDVLPRADSKGKGCVVTFQGDDGVAVLICGAYFV